MAFQLFGYEILKKKPTQALPKVPVTPLVDGTTLVNSANMSGYYGFSLDIDGSVRNEVQMINRYREIASYPDCDTAIEQIINEAVIVSESKRPVDLNLDSLPENYNDEIKDSIREHFDKILSMLKFNENCHDIFKRWYIDGKLYYYVVVDSKRPTKGILDIKYIDPRKIRKIVEYVKELEDGIEVIKDTKEYYVFNDNGLTDASQGIRLSTDSVIHVKSGLVDASTGEVISHLHKAIKPVNQLKMMEDALVVYRITRAPERRVFYVDVGNLPAQKAEQYVSNIMSKFRNKVVYDAETGEVKNNRNYMSMCLAMDTKVPLLDGRTLSIEEIAKEYQDKELWAYSCDPQTGKFAPGLITWAGVTRKNQKVMRITLDNGKSITCTLDHKFPIRDGGFVEAKDLVVGQSLMPFATKESGKKLLDNESKSWVSTESVVKEWSNDKFLTEQIFVGESDIVHSDESVTVAKIEYLDDLIDVGCLTIDGTEKYHNYHTFATDAGVYVKNCEDFWLPRREGGKATEISTLPAGQNLSEIDDIVFFQNKLYQALNVPKQRLMSDTLFNLGSSAEITREEVLFSKFIQRLRNNFNVLFKEALRIELICSRVINAKDWDDISHKIFFDYQQDNYFEELKRIEVMNERMTQVQNADAFRGTYFSREWIVKNILQFGDEEWNDIKEQIALENAEENGEIVDVGDLSIEDDIVDDEPDESLVGDEKDYVENDDSETELEKTEKDVKKSKKRAPRVVKQTKNPDKLDDTIDLDFETNSDEMPMNQGAEPGLVVVNNNA